MRISDWSSDVCSSDLPGLAGSSCPYVLGAKQPAFLRDQNDNERGCAQQRETQGDWRGGAVELLPDQKAQQRPTDRHDSALNRRSRSEEHTSELQSLMRNSYAVFCLKKKKKIRH